MNEAWSKWWLQFCFDQIKNSHHERLWWKQTEGPPASGGGTMQYGTASPSLSKPKIWDFWLRKNWPASLIAGKENDRETGICSFTIVRSSDRSSYTYERNRNVHAVGTELLSASRKWLWIGVDRRPDSYSKRPISKLRQRTGSKTHL